jgi:hypothetical protein
MMVLSIPKKYIKCTNSSANIDIDEQSTKLSHSKMIHYLENKVGVVDFAKG